jgi:hypothetical protein
MLHCTVGISRWGVVSVAFMVAAMDANWGAGAE